MSSRRPRRAIPVVQKQLHKAVSASALETGGKMPDARLVESVVDELTEEEDVEESVSKQLFIPIEKVNSDQQTITGVVLVPEVVDAQGDIISKEVIATAAHMFLASYNAATKLGLMHKDFKPQFELYESFIAPMDMSIVSKVVKAGSWVIVIHVMDTKVWEQVKSGKLTGFSIGGKAKVVKITQPKTA